MKSYLLSVVVLVVCVPLGSLCRAQTSKDVKDTTYKVCNRMKTEKADKAQISTLPVACKDRPHSVTLSWKASASIPPPYKNGEGYNVYRWKQIDGSCGMIKQAVEATSYVDCGVDAGQTYRYAVTAVQQSHESDPTNVVEAKIP